MEGNDVCPILLPQLSELLSNLTRNGCNFNAFLQENSASGSHGGHGGHENHSGHESHGGGGGGGHGGHGGHGGCDSTVSGSYSIGLHIAAIFILLVVSFIGTLIPLAGKYVPALKMPPFIVVLGKCISTGVIIAVSMLFIIQHAIHGFMEDCLPEVLKNSYPAYALLLAMIAAILMHALDVQLDSFLERWVASEETSEAAENDIENAEASDDKVSRAVEPAETRPTGHSCHGHATAAASQLSSARRIAAAVFLEFGLALHSVFLGISVGIANDADTKVLLIALSFHQLFEGVALGSRLADASMRTLWEMVLTIIFSVSVPVGVAVGLGTVKGSDISMSGSTFVTLQAIFNAVCGGILLYIGFSLMFSDFPSDLQKFAGPNAPHHGWKRLAMLFSLWVGAAAMAVLGKWH